MKVSDIQLLLNEYEPLDDFMIRVGYNLIPIDSVQLEVPEPLSMFDDPQRCCVLLIKDEYDLR